VRSLRAELARAIHIYDADGNRLRSVSGSSASGESRAARSGVGVLRDTVTNNEGYYTFASVPVGTYELNVEAKGFEKYKASDIEMRGGEKRNLNVSLTVGATTETVDVTGVNDAEVPVDSGEKSTTLSTKELQNFIQTGSNAAEFIKIMPGFGINNGTSNAPNYTGEVIGINGGGNAGSQSPLNGAYSYNGLPGNSLDITADGAHVSDPGCNCDTPVNPNSDMIAEIKVTMSNFSAENQKGPAVISTVAKSGGRDLHGSGFFYARNYAMNANDALFNQQGQSRPENKYYYPGFTVGGPVLFSRKPISTRNGTSCSSLRATSTSTRCSTPASCRRPCLPRTNWLAISLRPRLRQKETRRHLVALRDKSTTPPTRFFRFV
jgi:hypothetical protein